MKKQPKSRKAPRSSKTGKFVTKKYANSHKGTTQVNTVKIGRKKKKPTKKTGPVNRVSTVGSGALDDN